MKTVFEFALFASASAFAADMEAGLGLSDHAKKNDGYWYQEGFPHKLELKALAVKVGVTGDLWQNNQVGISYHANWVHLGAIHSQALAVPDDANYNLATKKCNGPCLPLANFRGSGHDQGLFLTIDPYRVISGWRVALEAGPYLHRPVWSEAVYNWQPDVSRAPITVHVNNESKWMLALLLAYRSVAETSRYRISGSRTAALIAIRSGRSGRALTCYRSSINFEHEK